MKKCKDCGAAIAEQYERCMPCNNKAKALQGAPPGESNGNELIRAIGALNNNAYCIRRQLEVILREKYGRKIVWDKEKKDFVEK